MKRRLFLLPFLLVLAMLVGGTIAGAVQGLRQAVEIEELKEEIRILEDSLYSCKWREGRGRPDIPR